MLSGRLKLGVIYHQQQPCYGVHVACRLLPAHATTGSQDAGLRSTAAADVGSPRSLGEKTVADS